MSQHEYFRLVVHAPIRAPQETALLLAVNDLAAALERRPGLSAERQQDPRLEDLDLRA